jgi:hypothetical protein
MSGKSSRKASRGAEARGERSEVDRKGLGKGKGKLGRHEDTKVRFACWVGVIAATALVC